MNKNLVVYTIPNVYIIMGEKNMRKSSTMRGLTGVYQQNVYDITHTNGNVRKTFVNVSSLQEADFTESEFVNFMNNNITKQYDDIFISLRINGFKHPKSDRNLNSGDDYIKYFKNVGWNVIEIVEFQDSNNIIPIGNTVTTLTIYNTGSMPANSVAKIVRKKFKWE